MKTKVMYICSTLKRTGPTNQLLNITKNLNEKHHPIVVTLSSEPKESMMEDFLQSNIEVVCLKSKRIDLIFNLKNKVKLIIEKIKPDIIHSQGVRSDYILSKLSLDIPKVSTLRNYPQYDYPMTYGFLFGRTIAYQHTKALKKFDAISAVSNGVRNNLINNYYINNSRTIYNGVDTDRFRHMNNNQKLREELGIPLDAKVWISVGHLCKRKDPISIINVFNKFIINNTNHYLIFVGDGSLREECETLSNENIIFTGRVTNVKDYLSESNFFISASKAEGFPNTVLESLACEVPVLLSNIEPHKEFFDLNNQIGEIFNNEHELYENMLKVSHEDYSIYKANSKKIIFEFLSAGKMAEKYQELYSEVINRE